MNTCDQPYVITISHQIGSGGADIGQKLSERLGIPFMDHQILQEVSKKLHLAEVDVARREERLSSFWQSFERMAVLTDPSLSLAADHYDPTDKEFFQVEAETIRRIAENRQSIFIGRCCRYVLRDHPCHFSLLVHAAQPARVKRLQALYSVSAEEAAQKIKTNDHDRNSYIRAFTGLDWRDARLYDLCLDTSAIGLEKSFDIVLAAVEARFGMG